MRTILVFLTLVLLTGLAYAADVPAPDVDTSAWLKAVYEAATKGEWKMLAGLVLIGIVFVLRAYGSKYIKWFATSTGGTILNFVGSLGGTIGLALAAGAPVTFGLVLTGISTAATATGLWELIKRYIPSVNTKNEKIKAAAGAPSAVAEAVSDAVDAAVKAKSDTL